MHDITTSFRRRISDDMNAMLIKSISHEEIKAAIFGI